MDIDDRWQPVIKTSVILDMLRERLGSDYKTSMALSHGKRPSLVSALRKRGGILTDEQGLDAARLLDFPADAILLSLAAERAMNTENAREIQRLAEQHYPPDFDNQDDHPTDRHKKTA